MARKTIHYAECERCIQMTAINFPDSPLPYGWKVMLIEIIDDPTRYHQSNNKYPLRTICVDCVRVINQPKCEEPT